MKQALSFNKMFYDSGERVFHQKLLRDTYQKFMSGLQEKIEKVLILGSQKSFNRGDYKVSVDKFEKKVALCGFRLNRKYLIGPVDVLGGMGVLVFEKE